ncbi:MAG TPA: hypothetical protein DG048_01015 [Pseudoalteromonas sp.]|nr:hypothetical protein [Pseudoalteromonas sp.]|tara:strand:- start:618 stop:869 length:252 start_codon:yes stop_codon:yes gene_type:complete
MDESKAMKCVLAVLSAVTAVCMPIFLYYVSIDLLEFACIFALINMGVFSKLYLGAKRYFKQQELGLSEPSGKRLLSYALFEFY